MGPGRSRAQDGNAGRLVIVLALFVWACGGPTPSAAPTSAGDDATASARASARLFPPTPSAAPSTPSVIDGPIAASGSIALLGLDGSLSLVDASGRSARFAEPVEGTYGFPTWSPDGTQVAAIRVGPTGAAIEVFEAAALGSGGPVDPLVIFESATIGPYYLYWTADGEAVSFLASDAGETALRIAPADASAPLDGSGPGALVRTGSPFYYDWIGSDRMLAHIGIGPEALLGEIGLDGEATAPAMAAPGDFRSAVVNGDGTSMAFVRVAEAGRGDVVVAARDGSNEYATEVFGSAAVVFDPGGTMIASIGQTEPTQAPVGFPLGPLRLIDVATGDVRTLVEGRVLSFWWSPDARTIAALRVQPVEAATEIPVSSPPASPVAPANEVRLVFVDVATGVIRSQPVVQPGQRFIGEFLAFFDQYALSHQVWAPDSSSILLPQVGRDGATRVTILFPDDDPPLAMDGVIGFWSP